LKCAYCGKERPLEELKEGKIICRERDTFSGKQKIVTKNKLFCKDAPCQGYYQMGEEG